MPETLPTHASRHPIGNSILATLAGYVAGVIGLTIWALVISGSTQYLVVAMFIAAGWLASVLIPCWVVVVLPLWLWLPAESSLWRPGRATALGAVFGSLLITVFVVILNVFELRTNYTGLLLLVPVGTIIGAITGYVSASLRGQRPG